MVALRKESVDRNQRQAVVPAEAIPSLSARRAWIEISWARAAVLAASSSLSARRAWIEIKIPHRAGARYESLSARRAWIEIRSILSTCSPSTGRSPQGERG